MGILSKTVKVYPRGKAINHYKEKGYDAKYNQELEVKVEDLSLCSTELIRVVCDYCGEEKEPMKYVDYNAQTKNGTKKCCCLDCIPLKREEAMIEKYGYKTAFQVPEIKKKIQTTNQERYGSNSPSSSSEVRMKQKETLMKNYGVENPSLSKELQEKRKQTFIDRYGVENPLMVKEIKEKAQQTIFERYGVENVSQNKDIQDKRIQTFMDRFGVIAPLQNKECFEKLKQTNMEKYGVEFVSQLEEVKQKARQTSLEKFGVDNPSKSEEIREKVKNTNLERYGVEYLLSLPSFHEHSREVDMERYGVYHHLQNPEILAKQKETFYKHGTCPTSKQQNYLHKIYGGELNSPFVMYNLDIYLPYDRINIEYDGSGHRLSCELGYITEEEFRRKETIRNITVKKAGIKQMRIISTTDKLPSDTVLLQMLQDTRTYFSDYPEHSWIEFNLDNSTLRNAEHKSGTPYNFGPLRTIKDSDLNNTIK